MLLSVCLDPRRPWRDLLALAGAADAAGLSTVYVVDHFMPVGGPEERPAGDILEGWTTVSALATSTTRIRLGTLVLGNTYRHPAVLANMAATLDHVSSGRVVLGLGAGWQENEHAAYGLELPPPARRLERLDEAAQVLRRLLHDDVVTFAGRHYQLDRARCDPKPLQQPLPLLIAGAGERRTIPTAARHADAWHCWATPQLFRHKVAVLETACDAIGRDASDVRRLTGQTVLVTERTGRPGEVEGDDVVGPADHVITCLAAYRNAGVDEFVVRDHAATPVNESAASLAALGSMVAPALR